MTENKTQETVICDWCGKEIKKEDSIIHPLYHHLNGHFYCSKECAQAYIECVQAYIESK